MNIVTQNWAAELREVQYPLTLMGAETCYPNHLNTPGFSS